MSDDFDDFAQEPFFANEPFGALVYGWLNEPPRDDLRRYPRAMLTLEQRALIERAIADARAAGLRLPPFTLDGVQSGHGPDREVQSAQAERSASGSYAIVLDVSVPWPRLRKLVFHELQHLADFAAGLDQQVSRAVLELRARRFANGMTGDRT